METWGKAALDGRNLLTQEQLEAAAGTLAPLEGTTFLGLDSRRRRLGFCAAGPWDICLRVRILNCHVFFLPTHPPFYLLTFSSAP